MTPTEPHCGNDLIDDLFRTRIGGRGCRTCQGKRRRHHPLTEIEMFVQVRARRLAGALTNAKYRKLLKRVESMRGLEPFIFQPLSGAIFSTALRQHREAESIHCRSFDRLHLAAMEELDLTRLMTHDARQAEAARAQGFEVITP